MSEETKAPETKAPEAEAAPEPVDPRVEKATEKLEFLRGKLLGKFGEDVLEAAELKQFQPTFTIKNANWVEVVEHFKTDSTLAFVYPQLMAGTDYKDYIEVYILLHSFTLDTDISLKTRTPRDNASVPSITHLFAGFNWEEREIYDLLGVDFPGHPDMRRIMLEDDWIGHPLRKDYVVEN
ncbi:NADH-quinone oxidoreductase subunit C [Tumebacillus sp. ITR2]|uniref:NADH-quinone oxidoreductase n=1 Tax=Tumebacillus amylolyticus TaxID=2801339 RepID=A0ABS1J5E0_9BACL|nr:NADH-quinone oxidoreductase subunit C [Tumebacillus amylolyticus]MBL0385447.1 NADH-quinone oxidoreductase subunit C [Tumebacillus amylolyticus]